MSSQITTKLWQTCITRSKYQESLLQLYTAHDILIKDLSYAPCNNQKWKECNEVCMVWHMEKKNVDIGWQLEHEKLIRIEGLYNGQKNQWVDKTKSVIATPVKGIHFTYKGDPQITCILFTLFNDTTRVEGAGAPLCGRLSQNKTQAPSLS